MLPIGRPLANYRAYVLDHRLEPSASAFRANSISRALASRAVMSMPPNSQPNALWLILFPPHPARSFTVLATAPAGEPTAL